MTTISVLEYWPFWASSSKVRRFDYTAIDGSMPPISSVFTYDTKKHCMKLWDYDAHLNLKDIWYYDYRPGKGGIAEFQDDYPESGKIVSLDGLFGRPIFWGDVEQVGSSIVNYPKMNPVKSWPPAFAGGVQCVAFEQLLPEFTLKNGKRYTDVLVYSYLQSFDGKPAGGARYWAANGIGPIRIVWLAQDPKDPLGKPLIETSPIEAVVTDYGDAMAVA